MMKLCSEVLEALSGKTLVTAESLTGGGIGAALTAVPGSSAVYKGGIISYTNWVKETVLGVSRETLETHGAVSLQTAEEMAVGVRKLLHSDVAVSVTGLAGPGGDEYGNPVGTVCIGFCNGWESFAVRCHFEGDREAVRRQTIRAALELVFDNA
ncbi:MAG: CinA family protein [Oscillospiraceae bacterium]|nr:CinA family protein [Oscillospiraceae bacterium]